MPLLFTDYHETLHLTLTFSYEDGAFTVIGHNPFSAPSCTELENRWRLPYSQWKTVDTLLVSAHVVDQPKDFRWQLYIADDESYMVDGSDMEFELGFPTVRQSGMEFDVRAISPVSERYIHVDLDNPAATKSKPRPIIIKPPAPPDTSPPTGVEGQKFAWQPYPNHTEMAELLIDDYLFERVKLLRRAAQPGSPLPPQERDRITRELYVHMTRPASGRRPSQRRPREE